jgi:hypothetical protein
MDTLVSFVSRSFGEAVQYAMGVDRAYREAAILNVASITVQRLRKLSFEVLQKETIDVCGTLPQQERVACIRGLVDGLIEHGSPQDPYEDSLALCGASIGVLQAPCYQRLVQNISRTTPAEMIESTCRRMPESYYKKCVMPLGSTKGG